MSSNIGKCEDCQVDGVELNRLEQIKLTDDCKGTYTAVYNFCTPCRDKAIELFTPKEASYVCPWCNEPMEERHPYNEVDKESGQSYTVAMVCKECLDAEESKNAAGES